jgi:phosphoribosylglycinamide formyltransferase-1
VKDQKKKIAVFASGNGTNAGEIFEYFKVHNSIEVSFLLTNKSNAPVIQRANSYKIPIIAFNRNTFYATSDIPEILLAKNIDLIVLAGFMWLIPASLVNAFPNKIINIHPALLPKYGGKGMYGSFVHEAVIASKEVESGITIHFVNEKYDEGNIIFQKSCQVDPNDTPESLAGKIHQLEHSNYPQVIENLLHN